MLIGLLVIIVLQLAAIVFIVHSNARERADLLQRIQAPEVAVIRHDMGKVVPPDPDQLPFDDDKAFFESRDELVQRMAAFDEATAQ